MRNKMEDSDNVDPENTLKTIKYVRRADRTPEKDFYIKGPDEKLQSCLTRSAVKRVREKVTRLEDEINKRDKEIDVEKKLRQEAENKLEAQFINMYNSPEVNEELRARLPRANKSDPFKQGEVSVEDEDEEDQRVPLSKPAENTNSDSTTPEKPVKPSETDQGARPKTVQRSLDFSSDTRSPVSTSMQSQAGVLDKSHTFPSFTGYSPLSGIHAPGLINPLHHSSLNSVFQSPYLRTSLLSPSLLTRNRSSSLLNTSYPNQAGDHETIVSRSDNTTLSSPPTAYKSSSDTTRETTFPREATLNTSTGAVGGDNLQQSGLDLGARVNGSHPYMPFQHSPMLTSVLPDPYITAGSARISPSSNLPLDQQNRQITILLNELDAQREEVKKMKKMLADRDLECEALKLTLKTRDVDTEGASTETAKAAGIIEEVYAAQKMRDDASRKRMKVLKDDSDYLIGRLQEVEARLDNHSNPSLDGFATLEDEDIHLQMPPSPVDQHPSRLIGKVDMMLEQQKIMQEEMQIVTDQRDMALAKCQKLERELQRYQRERDADGGMDKNLRAKLAVVRQERDMAIAKSKQLDDEIQKICLSYSLSKDLRITNQQSSNNSNTATAPTTNTEEVRISRHEWEQAQHKIKDYGAQLEMYARDKKQLETVTQDKERLERLVRVLRRKLLGHTDDNNENNEE